MALLVPSLQHVSSCTTIFHQVERQRTRWTQNHQGHPFFLTKHQQKIRKLRVDLHILALNKIHNSLKYEFGKQAIQQNTHNIRLTKRDYINSLLWGAAIFLNEIIFILSLLFLVNICHHQVHIWLSLRYQMMIMSIEI